MDLDDVFVRKDEAAIAIYKESLDAVRRYSHDTAKALVTDIDPDTDTKIAMNRFNAAERNKIIQRYARHAGRGHTTADEPDNFSLRQR